MNPLLNLLSELYNNDKDNKYYLKPNYQEIVKQYALDEDIITEESIHERYNNEFNFILCKLTIDNRSYLEEYFSQTIIEYLNKEMVNDILDCAIDNFAIFENHGEKQCCIIKIEMSITK